MSNFYRLSDTLLPNNIRGVQFEKCTFCANNILHAFIF